MEWKKDIPRCEFEGGRGNDKFEILGLAGRFI
jgi:hypothetical protein